MFGVHQTQFWNYNLVSQQRRESSVNNCHIPAKDHFQCFLFSASKKRFPCHSKMKSQVLSVLSLSHITNTSRGNSNGFTGVKPTSHQLSTGFICLWCVVTTMYPRRSSDLTCGPDQITCPVLLGGLCSMLSPGNSGELYPCMIPPLKHLLL